MKPLYQMESEFLVKDGHPNYHSMCFALTIQSITIFIQCGSRNETEETSGTAHFLEHLHFKGTGKRSRESLESDVENIGAHLNAYTSRENTSYTINFLRDQTKNAVEILGDMLTNSLYSSQAVENERNTIHRELIETRKSQFETTIEISHRGAYANHQMALPILGLIKNMYSINRDMIVQYKEANYFGKNLIVVGGGDIDHNELCHYMDKYFSKMPANPTLSANTPGKPKFCTDKVFMMESDLTEDVNVGAFYEAPPWNDPAYYDFLIFQRLMADAPDNMLEAVIYSTSELNSFQKKSLQIQEIISQKAVYTPYHDTALFGNYFMVQQAGVKQVIDLTASIVQQYSEKIDEVELQRAKRRLFVELFQHETGNDITQAIANQVLYFGRRIYRQEIARNIAACTSDSLKQTIRKWCLNKPLSITLWGNVKPIMNKYQNVHVGHH